MKVVVFGDSFIGLDVFRQALAGLAEQNDVRFLAVDEGTKLIPATPSEKSLREYLGSPRQLIPEVRDAEVLVVHGAPVSDEVMAAAPNLRVVCCARGGPVNVDVAAATKRGIQVVTAPGKNAEAVAELAMALMVILSRNLIKAYDHVRAVKVVGNDNFEGARFTGSELEGKTLGLIGFGRVGSKVAKKAIAFGMRVLVYDPFLSRATIESEGIAAASFEQTMKSDYVSLHARESKENENLVGRKQFSLMKRGSYFVNTARPSLVDESALLDALKNGTLAGAAVDVVRYEPARPVNPLLELDNIVVLPHIAGATRETTTKGAFIVANQLELYAKGEMMETVINPEARAGR